MSLCVLCRLPDAPQVLLHYHECACHPACAAARIRETGLCPLCEGRIRAGEGDCMPVAELDLFGEYLDLSYECEVQAEARGAAYATAKSAILARSRSGDAAPIFHMVSQADLDVLQLRIATASGCAAAARDYIEACKRVQEKLRALRGDPTANLRECEELRRNDIYEALRRRV